jgi:hypothetical protein
VEAPAEQIHEVLNNKKSCMIFESELQRVWPGEKEKRREREKKIHAFAKAYGLTANIWDR